MTPTAVATAMAMASPARRTEPLVHRPAGLVSATNYRLHHASSGRRHRASDRRSMACRDTGLHHYRDSNAQDCRGDGRPSCRWPDRPPGQPWRPRGPDRRLQRQRPSQPHMNELTMSGPLKSRRYSTTLGSIRAKRRTHRQRQSAQARTVGECDDGQGTETLVIGSWHFGSPLLSSGRLSGLPRRALPDGRRRL